MNGDPSIRRMFFRLPGRDGLDRGDELVGEGNEVADLDQVALHPVGAGLAGDVGAGSEDQPPIAASVDTWGELSSDGGEPARRDIEMSWLSWE